MKASIPTPSHAGVQSINLKDWNLALEPDVQYRWYISAIRNPDSPSQDIVAGGVIERCEFSTCLVEMEVDLSCDRHSVLRNASRGFWYDAMACLCDVDRLEPFRPSASQTTCRIAESNRSFRGGEVGSSFHPSPSAPVQ